MTGHTVQIPQGTYGSQRVQQTQNTRYTNNYSNIDEVSKYYKHDRRSLIIITTSGLLLFLLSLCNNGFNVFE